MDDTSLLDEWARRADLEPRRTPEADVAWGDIEVAFGVRAVGDRFALVYANRGHWTVDGTTSSRHSADAMLLVRFGQLWRSFQGLGDAFSAAPALGATMDRRPEGYAARVEDERGTFVRVDDARVFTHVANLPLAEISSAMAAR